MKEERIYCREGNSKNGFGEVVYSRKTETPQKKEIDVNKEISLIKEISQIEAYGLNADSLRKQISK